MAKISCPWGSGIPISSDIGAGTTYVQGINGELRIAYRNSSKILIERIWNSSTSTWGPALPIATMNTNNVKPSYIQRANGDLRIAYTNASDNLVERTWNKSSSTWGDESPIESAGYEPNYIELANGDLRISYNDKNAVLYERTWNSSTQTWGMPLIISTWGSNAAYIQLANGDLRIAYTNTSDNLVERTWNKSSSTWGDESPIESGGNFPTYVQLSSKELHIIYNTSSLSLVEKIWNASTSTWGSTSPISTSQFTRPFAIQTADGELRVGYSNNLGIISEMRKTQYAKIGAGIIESGSNTTGHWLVFSNGLVIEFGTILVPYTQQLDGYYGSTSGYTAYGVTSVTLPYKVSSILIGLGSPGRQGGAMTARAEPTTSDSLTVTWSDGSIYTGAHEVCWLAIGVK
jgi:hypothetical protein